MPRSRSKRLKEIEEIRKKFAALPGEDPQAWVGGPKPPTKADVAKGIAAIKAAQQARREAREKEKEKEKDKALESGALPEESYLKEGNEEEEVKEYNAARAKRKEEAPW